METDTLYRDNILDHHHNPRNYGSLENSDIHLRELNPLCGDEIEIYVKLDSGKVKEMTFTGKGCAISQASASMLTEKVAGKKLSEIMKLSSNDIVSMLGATLTPSRIKCATLSLEVLHKAVLSLK